jgi:hypothetical protein
MKATDSCSKLCSENTSILDAETVIIPKTVIEAFEQGGSRMLDAREGGCVMLGWLTKNSKDRSS